MNAFAAAPVPSPDGSTGITLHAMADQAITDVPNFLFSSAGPGATDDFVDLKTGTPGNPCDGFFGTAGERSSPDCANILGAWQLLATYFNLATRRINAGTSIVSRTAAGLGLTNVREAALYGQATLALPVGPSTQHRYKATTTVLDEINQNKSEVY